MHLRSCLLPRPNASSPLDNRTHPMANTSQVPDLEGLHREIHGMAEQMRIMNDNNAHLIQHLTTNNLPPPHVARIPEVPRRQNKSTTQKIRDLNARIDAINRGTSAPVTVDALIKQTEPTFIERGYSNEVMCKAFSATLKGSARSWFRKLSPGTIDSFDNLSRMFIANFMSCRVRQKNASHLFTIHQKETENLKDYVKCFNQVVLEVEDPSDKVVVMAMMEGLRPGPLFDSLLKNVPETLSTLQSKADKYIIAEELAGAKCKRRGKDDKRKEPNTRRTNYRDEMRNKRPNRDSRQQTNDRRSCTPPRRPELVLSPLNAPITQNATGRAEEEVYNLSSPTAGSHLPITFTNDDLRGLHVPHDDVLVISAIIANFNVQRILVDNWSLVDILFISAFDKIKIELDKLHPFHTPLVEFGGNTTYLLRWINLPVTLGEEPHQTTVWQDFIMVDCSSPYNAILRSPNTW
ncbi:hypothetical protein Acr_00g0021330 [Actinidia rufa]|uniref:Retrotransposon gag domain-containing protein n=1 Tax=Actinidia rufa TaxID=165716 RepID=A0A7J0DE02_9ERIC|nr:hypothetical protein Acr_00g0021330 [Actinidia rufa]